jgi:hypothetical protein
VRAGADVKAKNKQESTPIDVASVNGEVSACDHSVPTSCDAGGGLGVAILWPHWWRGGALSALVVRLQASTLCWASCGIAKPLLAGHHSRIPARGWRRTGTRCLQP